ncbi:MAG TPA: hypothetical protein VGB59_11800 [Allosphingosinicella sp.]|jgi:hypothetical protein
MAETKTFASLSSGLLARKGGAKPAMRPQSFASFGGNIEDLGWNDMGHEAHPAPEPVALYEPEAAHAPAPEPVVVEQQRTLAASFKPAAPKPAAASRAELPAKAKAAFTLRLDPERHLKLRLACALTRRSAQQLVTEALDEFLKSLPEVDAMAGRAPAQTGNS